MNKSDSERIAGYLEDNGYKQANNRKNAKVVIINTCGIRQSAEDRVCGLISMIKKENSKAIIVLTGCLSKRIDVQKKFLKKVDIWLCIEEIYKLIFKLNKFYNNYCSSKNNKLKNKNYLKIKPKHNSSFSAFVPIGNGCNNFCSYCVVPYARGREKYRLAADILKEVKELICRGYKEIILIAQNVNSYKSGNINFVKLLQMINEIKGEFWIRFLTSHPKDMNDKLIKAIAECDKVCKHIHLPAQSGDSNILAKMNRKYNISHYKKLINKIKRFMPQASITTDIIVGFPGETKAQFINTKKLFREMKFDMAYISKYSPRPGTVAEKLKDNVKRSEKKVREEELMKILRKTAFDNNKKYKNKIFRILVESRNKNGEWIGRTETNKKVKFISDNNKNLIGEFRIVKIENTQDFGLKGILK